MKTPCVTFYNYKLHTDERRGSWERGCGAVTVLWAVEINNMPTYHSAFKWKHINPKPAFTNKPQKKRSSTYQGMFRRN